MLPGSKRLRLLGCLGTALALVLAVTASSAGEDDERYDRALKNYQRNIDRPSLSKRSAARLRLAETRDQRALELLVRDYANAEDPTDMVRYYLAITLTREFGEDPKHLEVFRTWREQHTRPMDSFLWYRALVREIANRSTKVALDIVRSQRGLYLRLAALAALVREEADECLELIPELLASLPEDPAERAMIVESLGACLATQDWRLKEPEFDAPAQQLIKMLDDEATLPRTKHVLARYFGDLLETEDRFVKASPWLNALLFARQGEEGSDAGYARKLVFGGIEATGDRIAYVIDLSDSMLKPLAPEDLAALQKLPKAPPPKPGKKKKRRKGRFADARRIDWNNVKTRFDAAREMLKLSLLSLPEDKQFVVILFGDEANLMKACKGLQYAKPKHVNKVLRELNGIRKLPTEKRPEGGLRGGTNLHGGMLHAFRVVRKGVRGSGEYVDAKAHLEGVETIFLLSDGQPTFDNWAQEDRRDPDDRVGDSELGTGETKETSSATLIYSSPFANDRIILGDLERLNLFRKCEIHCVGIGDASRNYLQQIAKIGMGKIKMIGTDK